MKQRFLPYRPSSNRFSSLGDVLLGVLLAAALFQVFTCFETFTSTVPNRGPVSSVLAIPSYLTNAPLVNQNGTTRHEKS